MVVSLERIRLADGEPIALMHNFLPTGLVHLSIDMLEQHGLYELLRASGIRLGSATQRMCAKNASAAEARILHENRGAALLTVERTAYDETGRPLGVRPAPLPCLPLRVHHQPLPHGHHRHPPRRPLGRECDDEARLWAPDLHSRAFGADEGALDGRALRDHGVRPGAWRCGLEGRFDVVPGHVRW